MTDANKPKTPTSSSGSQSGGGSTTTSPSASAAEPKKSPFIRVTNNAKPTRSSIHHIERSIDPSRR